MKNIIFPLVDLKKIKPEPYQVWENNLNVYQD